MARRKPKRPPGRSGRTAPWLIAAIALFIVGDLLLVWAAISSVRNPPPNSGATAAPFEYGPTPSASPTPEPTTAADFDVAPPTALLSAYDVDVAYRASTGDCVASAPTVEVTTDGGATWAPVNVSEVSAIESIVAESVTNVSIVARDSAACTPAVFRSFVQGDGWTIAEELADRWRIDGNRVIAPGEAASEPCSVPLQVAPRSASEVAVLCGDAVVYSTTDGGVSWQASQPISGAAALAAASTGYLVAIEAQESCAGVSVATLDTALDLGALGGCVEVGLAEGTTAVAQSGDGSTIWLRTGDVIARSFDGGQTW